MTQFDLSAHSGPTSDFGHVAAKTPTFDIYVDVDCVNINGIPGTFMGAATISGVIRRATADNTIGEPGEKAFFYIRDGGTPTIAPVDAFYFVGGNLQGLTCDDISPTLFSFTAADVESGNIVIKNG
jgi:hypothetical protein